MAWGYLVPAAIDFGTVAREGAAKPGGSSLAAVGAAACLFLALILITRITRAMGITKPRPPDGAAPRDPQLPAGGHRASH